MWLFTRYGFFSAVCAREGKSGSGKVDVERIMVRARVRQHLDKLIAAFPGPLASAEILESPSNDYRFRFFVPKPVWAEVVASLVMDTDYDNFKSACHKVFDAEGDPGGYVSGLHKVWNVTNDMQRRVSGPGIYDKPKAQRVDTYAKGGGGATHGGGAYLTDEQYAERLLWDEWQSGQAPVAADRKSQLDSATEDAFRSARSASAALRAKLETDAPPPPPLPPLAGAHSPGKSGRRPGPHDESFVVRDGSGPAAKVVGVVWWASEFHGPQEAYSEAVKCRAIPRAAEPFFGRERHETARQYQAPVYDWRSAD